ncbi:hypothetical protein J132_04684 [Termitomyces sp. J132]|nr:hypothetical protein J132_04684 [Termitomyces sp. J132]
MKRRAAGGKRSKEAEAIPQEISLRSSTRTDSNISSLTQSTAAVRYVEADHELVKASGVLGTPVKPSNLKYSGNPTTRQDVVDGFTHELLNRRWASADLVDHAFDNIVSISLATKITLCFLHHGILSVKCGNKEVKRDDWLAACLHAASLARLASKVGKVTREMQKRYTWSWSERLNTGTERGAQQFFNIVGVLGFIFGTLFGLDPTGLSERKLRTRITTLPRSYNRLPLESRDSQDCRPDFLALHRTAFVTASERKATREEEYVEKSSILLTISSSWPHLSKTYPEIFPSLSRIYGAGSHDPDSDEEDEIGPLSFTPEGDDELLSDVCNTEDSANVGEDTDSSSAEEESIGDLSLRLKNLLETLKAKDTSSRCDSVLADIKQYDNATFLDLSAVCFPNVLIAGEGKQTDMKSAIVQATVYMRQQRRTQFWLRFSLGLMATKDKLGLLRADATGVEECIFPKNIGRGVIESIRLSLGILLATDEELGQHPSFSLRSVTIMNAKYKGDDSTTALGDKRPADDDNDNERASKKRRSKTFGEIPSTPTKYPHQPKQFTSREVNWITLDKEKLHGRPPSDKTPTTFYVKYLVEDRGSLIGRCTRVWCVYQEVFKSDSILEKYEVPKDSRVFKGPYALKAYNADIYSEAYEQDILFKVMNHPDPIKGVLMPTDVWYLGQVLTLVRGLTQEECPQAIDPNKVNHRQEIFTVSAFKRTLSQFETMKEFYEAIIGVLQAIAFLESLGIIHRDISFGNIILNEEIYCDTDKECQWIEVEWDARPARVALIRREFVDIHTIGGLHDLDMAAYIPKTLYTLDSPTISFMTPKELLARIETRNNPPPVQQKKPNRVWRTGTVPFMSIPLLLGEQNSVIDDLQSLFFVCYLSPFTFGDRLPNYFPNAPPPLNCRWPEAFWRWTDLSGSLGMRDLGLAKTDFFTSSHLFWFKTLKSHALPLWNTSDSRDAENTVLRAVHCYMLSTFHKQLWTPVQRLTFSENISKVDPLSIVAALRGTMDIWDLDSDIPTLEP